MEQEDIKEEQPAERQKILRWVKASERKPEKGSICVNTASDEVWRTTTANGVYTQWQIDNIEWLEEIEAPAASPVIGDKPEREIPQMSDQISAQSDIAALDYGAKIEKMRGERSYDSCDITEAHESGQMWMYRRLMSVAQPIVAPPPVIETGEQKGEIPDGVNIVYDKIFVPTKNEPGGEYPSAVCDFDDDEQEWVPGDCFVKPIKGPVAFMSADFYRKLTEIPAPHPSPSPIVDPRVSEIQAYRQAFIDIIKRANWMSDEVQIARDILSKYPLPTPTEQAPIVETGEKQEIPEARTSLDQRFTKDFFLKVSVNSDLLPENEQNIRATLSTAIERAIYQELGRWRNTGVSVEGFKPEGLK